MRWALAGRRRDTKLRRLVNLLLGVPILLTARRLSALTGATYSEVEPPPTTRVTNPSVSLVDGSVMVAVRETNHVIDARGQYVPRTAEGLHSETWISPLDDAGRATMYEKVDLSSSEESLEDPRLIDTPEGPRLLWSRRSMDDDGPSHEMVTALLRGATVTRMQALRSPRHRRIEKNWMPFVAEGRVYFLYDVATMEVYELEANGLVQTSGLDEPIRELVGHSGSSQLIRCGNGWLGLTHWYLWTQGPLKAITPRIYFHHFVHFNQTVTAARLSRPFIFKKRGIEFCSGIAQVGDDLIVSFGIDDTSAHTARLPLRSVAPLFGGRSPISPLLGAA